MRRILIDRARRKLAARYGGGQAYLDVDEIEIAAPVGNDDELLAVHDALEKFAAEDREKAELVKLRYFVGLTIEDAAAVLGISKATAKRWWIYARAWLHQEIKAQAEDGVAPPRRRWGLGRLVGGRSCAIMLSWRAGATPATGMKK